MQWVAIERPAAGQGVLIEQRHDRPGCAARIGGCAHSLALLVRHAQDFVLARVKYPTARKGVAPERQARQEYLCYCHYYDNY